MKWITRPWELWKHVVNITLLPVVACNLILLLMSISDVLKLQPDLKS